MARLPNFPDKFDGVMVPCACLLCSNLIVSARVRHYYNCYYCCSWCNCFCDTGIVTSGHWIWFSTMQNYGYLVN